MSSEELSIEERATNDGTWRHIHRVQTFVIDVAKRLMDRALGHDQSKLEPPEVGVFAEMAPKLKGSTYGSAEYNGFLAAMKPALDHHYAANRHHPEHFRTLECNGCYKRFPGDYGGSCDVCGWGQFTARPDIGAMTLVDLIEMLCDWKAASERHADGDIGRSIEVNQSRFNISPQLRRILDNTAAELWPPGS